jgi:hypothetical protein
LLFNIGLAIERSPFYQRKEKRRSGYQEPNKQAFRRPRAKQTGIQETKSQTNRHSGDPEPNKQAFQTGIQETKSQTNRHSGEQEPNKQAFRRPEPDKCGTAT